MMMMTEMMMREMKMKRETMTQKTIDNDEPLMMRGKKTNDEGQED